MLSHILTIEDPIEYQLRNKKSIVNQREVGTDTQSQQIALKNALRQAPDVILIGEIRDRETMSAAIAYAQSGHLCLATLHGNSSYHALQRILGFYPVEERASLLGDLGSALRAVVTQRLVRQPDGHRIPAAEIMVNTPQVRTMIEKGDFTGIKDAMDQSMDEGSQTFEDSLAQLVLSGKIDRKEGLSNADSHTNLMWRLQNDPPTAAAASVQQAVPSFRPPAADAAPAAPVSDIVLDTHMPRP